MKRKISVCDNCKRRFPAELMLHCEHCGSRYCPVCAKHLAICECTGDLTYFD